MTSKRQRRSDNVKEKKKKKSTRILYFSMIVGGIFILLVLFFVILFSALFPTVDDSTLKNKEKQVAIIWFSDQQERFLVAEKRYINKENDTAEQAKEIVKALLDGSKNGNVNTFPDGVSLLDVKVDDSGIAYVNFTKSLTKLHPGSSTAEMATIYSLTNSLTENVAGIKKVKILVEGKDLSSIKGHISTQKAFRPDRSLFAPTKEGKS